MALNGDHASSSAVSSLNSPPGAPSSAYTLPSLSGEIIYIPCSKSAMRLLVTGKETNNAFAVVGTGGVASAPIGFHFHREAHDVFLCLKGNVNLWAGEKCRTMGPGDFASVPPHIIHQYQILGPYSEFLGLIVPGGWEEFFRFIGEPYTGGPLFPQVDDRNPFEVLIPKLKAAAQEFDMVPQPQHKSFDPQPWAADDNVLSGRLEPYFLRDGTGPAYIAGGTLVRPLATTKESGGRFAIGSIEGSNHHYNGVSPIFAGNKRIKFPTTHHCFQVSEGRMTFTVGDARADLTVGETLFIPAGSEFRLEFASILAKCYLFANAGGLVELLCGVGKKYDALLIPEQAEKWDGESQLDRLREELGFEMAG